MAVDITKNPKPIRLLRAFLCHSSGDKSVVRDLYHRLLTDGIDPWLDEENLLPGQDWDLEISKAVRNSDVVIVCLSQRSITKAGYIQKEIRKALDVADEQPEGIIFIIPVKLEECNVPERLRRWQWVNFFGERGYERLMLALRQRADEIKIDTPLTRKSSPKTKSLLGLFIVLVIILIFALHFASPNVGNPSVLGTETKQEEQDKGSAGIDTASGSPAKSEEKASQATNEAKQGAQHSVTIKPLNSKDR